MFFRLFIAAALLLVAQALSPLAAYGHDESALIETVSVTSDGGIKRLIISAGTGATAVKGSKIAAHYDGKLEDGTQFDSSRKRGTPFTFALGGGQVIKGWDQGFAGMKVGEKSILVISSEYGYGARGAGGVIPGGATLYFEVELVSVNGGEL